MSRKSNCFIFEEDALYKEFARSLLKETNIKIIHNEIMETCFPVSHFSYKRHISLSKNQQVKLSKLLNELKDTYYRKTSIF